MAETITNVLQVTVQDTDNSNYSFNIENPKENVTIQQVNAALEPLINTQKWYSAKDRPITRVKGATLTRTRKIILDDSTEITVTPAEWNINQQGQSASQTFTVTGEAIQGYNFTTQYSRVTLDNISIDTVNNTLKATISNPQPNSSDNGNLNIVTATQVITVPVTFYRSM